MNWLKWRLIKINVELAGYLMVTDLFSCGQVRKIESVILASISFEELCIAIVLVNECVGGGVDVGGD